MTTELLGIVIEFSIGLAGFSGVIAIFSGRSQDRVQLEIFRLRNLVLGASIPAFLSFIALGLLHALSDVDLAWLLALSLSVICLAVYIFQALRSRASMPKNQSQQLQKRLLFFFIGWLFLVIFLQLGCLFRLVPIQSFDAFYVGLISLLVISTYQFIRAVLEGVKLNANDTNIDPTENASHEA